MLGSIIPPAIRPILRVIYVVVSLAFFFRIIFLLFPQVFYYFLGQSIFPIIGLLKKSNQNEMANHGTKQDNTIFMCLLLISLLCVGTNHNNKIHFFLLGNSTVIEDVFSCWNVYNE